MSIHLNTSNLNSINLINAENDIEKNINLNTIENSNQTNLNISIDKEEYFQYKLEEFSLKNNILQNFPEDITKYFICDAPPPNLSGDLHIGHIFNATQPDIINRFYQMNGFYVVRPFGIDDNGIPTWKLLVKELGSQYFNANKQTLELEEQKSGILDKYILEYKKLLEDACILHNHDFNYRTRADFVAKISQQSFLDLYKKNELYAKNWPVNWDTGHNTAISNMEMVVIEKKSKMHHINFGLTRNIEHKNLEHFNINVKDQNMNIVDINNEIEVIIATTRPELLAACSAVLYNPEHKFANILKNKIIKVPLFNFYVPLIADNKVDPEKGTGFVMCCTFGDQTDIYWWDKFKLPLKSIITPLGKIDLSSCYNLETGEGSIFYKNLNVDIKNITNTNNIINANFNIDNDVDILNLVNKFTYCNELNKNLNNISNKINNDEALKLCMRSINDLHNLTINNAKIKIIEILELQDLIIKSEEITHNVATSERSGHAAQILCVPQWYINTIKHKDEILEINKSINWHPGFMSKKLEEWVENINTNWCISRQRPWGIQVPVFYNAIGEIILPEDEILPIKLSKKYYLDKSKKIISFDEHENPDESLELEPLRIDENVLDTWATSSLTNEIVLHLLKEKTKINKFSITNLRFQAHEIIRTWAFTTILRSYLRHKQIPWYDIIITGWCLAGDGGKISKSKNNAPDTKKIIKEYGIDAIRYWAVKARLGNDIAFCLDDVKNGNKLINKIINAAKFVQINFNLLNKYNCYKAFNILDFNLIVHEFDKIFLIKFITLINKIINSIKNYATADAFEEIERFFKSDFCDNYLEIIKKRFYNSENINTQGQISASYTCFIFMNLFLRILKPFMPKISEYLYKQLYQDLNLDIKNTSAIQEIQFQHNIWPQKELIASILNLNIENRAINDLINIFDSSIDIMEQIRKEKTKNKLSMNAAISSVLIDMKYNIDINIIIDIKNAANTHAIKCKTSDEDTGEAINVTKVNIIL